MAQTQITEMITMLGATGMGTVVVTFVTGGTVTSYARITGIAGIARGAARVTHFRSSVKVASGSGIVHTERKSPL